MKENKISDSTTNRMPIDYVIRIAGESGEGIVLAGEIVTLALSRSGFNIFTFRTYPAEVRGGPSMFQIRTSAGLLRSQGDLVDMGRDKRKAVEFTS